LKLANLFYSIGYYDKAIELSFKIRNEFIDNPQVHLEYIQIILDVSDRSTLLKKHDRVEIGDVVQLEDQSKKITSYYLHNESKPEKIATLLSSTSKLGSTILDKKVEDKINFEVPVGENIVIIKSILNKYIFAFQESGNNFSQQFIGHPGIFKIPFGTGKDGSLTDSDIQNIRELVEKNQKGIDTLLDLYKKRQFPISGISKQLNRDIFTVCSILSNNINLGIINCYNCSEKENENANNNLISSNKLIVDPVALYTICNTKIGDLIVNKFGKLGIGQSTVDMLRSFIFDLSGISSHGYMTLGLADGSMTATEITAEQIEVTRRHYEQFLEWIEVNCEIFPCYESLSIDPNKRREYESLFGHATFDSILLASKEGNVFYSDDGLIQGVAKELYNVKSVWSQVILSNLQLDNENEKSKLDQISIELLQQHHYPPKINSEILFSAAKKAQWEDKSPFTELLQIIGDSRSTNSFSIKTGADFVIKLWLNKVNIYERNYLFLKVLNTITQKGNKTLICENFIEFIHNNRNIFGFEKNEIIDLVFFYHDYLL